MKYSNPNVIGSVLIAIPEIPKVSELKQIEINEEIRKKQARGYMVIIKQLEMENKRGRHELSLSKTYLEKTYYLDILSLICEFENKGYKVEALRNGFGIIESIVVTW